MKSKNKKSTLMEYKEYKATIEFDAEEGIFHGEIEGITDIITFQGKSVTELQREMKNSIEDYLNFCKKKNRSPQKSFSGKLNLRMDSNLHQLIAVEAKKLKLSINEFINLALKEKLR